MHSSSRRAFLQATAASGIASTGIGLTRLAGATPVHTSKLERNRVSPNDKISVACIGVRGRGNSVMRSFAAESDCQITHICDVRKSVREQRGAEMRDHTGLTPTLVNDYRELLNDSSIDVFMVATPDHWHAMLTIEGCLAGKDVYVEKPASHNILEGKTAVAAARKKDRMVQMGTQIRSASFLKEAIEYVRSGALGQVIYGKSWETARNAAVHLPSDSAPPSDIDYEIWQGPAQERPYNDAIVGSAWRWLFDYGTGDLGNDGVHRIDYCRAAMGLDGMPDTISCAGGKHFFEDDQQWPDTMLVNFEYPGKVLQYEMLLWSRARPHQATEGATIYGENGWVTLTNTAWKAFDADNKLVKEGSSDVGQRGHIRNFIDAVISRDRDSLNQEIYSGHVSTVMCHAGNIAWRTGKKLRFNSDTELFDDEEANQYVGREHRRGFELPEV